MLRLIWYYMYYIYLYIILLYIVYTYMYCLTKSNFLEKFWFNKINLSNWRIAGYINSTVTGHICFWVEVWLLEQTYIWLWYISIWRTGYGWTGLYRPHCGGIFFLSSACVEVRVHCRGTYYTSSGCVKVKLVHTFHASLWNMKLLIACCAQLVSS